MFANGERERGERERLVQARQGKHCIGGSTSRERERETERERDRERERQREIERERQMCVCVFFLNFVSVFFYLSTYFEVLCRSLQKKKSDRTRCLAVSILEYNLGPKITGS